MKYGTIKKITLATVAGVLMYLSSPKDFLSPFTNNYSVPSISEDSTSNYRDTTTSSSLEESLRNRSHALILSPDSLTKLVNTSYDTTINDSTIKSYIK